MICAPPILETRTSEHGARPVRVALLGCGVVGQRVAELLLNDPLRIALRTGVWLQLNRILVRNPRKDRGIDQSLFTDRFDDLLRDDIDLAIEALGGVDPAKEFIQQLLGRGVSVVTANKSVMAHHGAELAKIAAKSGASLGYEATVGAAVPVLAALQRLRADRINAIQGVVNGTCNFLLTRMTEDRLTLEQALQEAERLGFAEPDPSADLSGRDSAEKLCILARAAGIGELRYDDVHVRGIEGISASDIAAAKRHGCVIKLVAKIERTAGDVRAFVGPALIPRSHALASTRLENNALLIESELAGELLLQGKGAGPDPTAAAILGDVVHLARAPRAPVAGFAHRIDPVAVVANVREPEGAFYFRLNENDAGRHPERVLATLRSHRVPVGEIEFAGGQVTVLTESTRLSQVESAAKSLGAPGKAPGFAAQRWRTGAVRAARAPREHAAGQAMAEPAACVA